MLYLHSFSFVRDYYNLYLPWHVRNRIFKIAVIIHSGTTCRYFIIPLFHFLSSAPERYFSLGKFIVYDTNREIIGAIPAVLHYSRFILYYNYVFFLIKCNNDRALIIITNWDQSCSVNQIVRIIKHIWKYLFYTEKYN